MGAQLDRLRYEVFQNLFYSPMDTGFLRSAVATVLTAYGIETIITHTINYRLFIFSCNSAYRLRYWNLNARLEMRALCFSCNSAYRLRYWNFNSLEIIITLVSCNSAYRLRYWNMFLAQAGDTQANACCNSAYRLRYWNGLHKLKILGDEQFSCNSAYRLRYWNVRPDTNTDSMNSLQQCLPLTVLKLTQHL